jgi:hypothetical protein
MPVLDTGIYALAATPRRPQMAGSSPAMLGGPRAGELTHLWVVAIERQLKLKHVAGMLAPYPTWGEVNKTGGGRVLQTAAFQPLTRRAVRALSWPP